MLFAIAPAAVLANAVTDWIADDFRFDFLRHRRIIVSTIVQLTGADEMTVEHVKQNKTKNKIKIHGELIS